MIDAAVTSAIATLQNAIDAAGTLQNASQATLGPIVVAANAALAAIDAQVATIEPIIDETAIGGLHVGTPAPQLAQTLIAQTQAVTDLAALETLRGYIGRLTANVVNAPG